MLKKITFYPLAVIFLLMTSPMVFSAQKSPPKSPPPKASFDIGGVWNFQTSEPKEYGGCDVGAPYSGKLTITQKDAHHLKLVMESGPLVCSPPSVCSYQGVMKGNEARFSNTVVAEGEAGTLINAIDLKIISNSAASGEVRNIQQFIGGAMCEWVHKIQLSR